MNKPHPYRYHDAFRGQLARLESLCPGITTGAQRQPPRGFIELEHRGASPLEIARYNRLLRHVERLVADWATDGRDIRFAEVDVGLTVDDVRELEIPKAPRSTVFVSFEPGDGLDLETQPRSRIDGFYVREIASEFKTMAELTFVCAEPGWQAMDICLYTDAMEIGSRIAIAEIPVDVPVHLSDLPRLLKGNRTLARDPALARAVCAATDFLESTFSKPMNLAPRLRT